jgi:hypothetical protein
VSQQQNPMERAVDLFVYAPIGVAMFAKDTVPTFLKMFVSRGQTELHHRRKTLGDQANQYRAVGKFAVKYGGPEVKRSAAAKVEGARRACEETFTGLIVPRLPGNGGGPQPVPDAPERPARPARAETPEARATPARPKPAARSEKNGRAVNGSAAKHPAPALAIPEYDMLSASQVVERLDGLTPAELDAVRDYEVAHRGRSTILGKIVQLTA